MAQKVDQSKKSSKKGKKKKSALREWVDSIVFAVVAATLIRWLFIEAYMIPTPSMEHSLLVGDYLFVSKMHYGARTPETPLQVPLTFQKIWGTDIPSYLDWIKLPMYRLPGFSEVKRNDAVVFNYPAEGLGLFKSRTLSPNPVPTDMKTYYIKRCVGMPGDKFEIKDQMIHIDGKPMEEPEGKQVTYIIDAKGAINESRVFAPNDITKEIGGRVNENLYRYSVKATEENIDKIRNLDFVIKIDKPIVQEPLHETVFHPNGTKGWSLDNFGPITIPKEGMTVKLDSQNVYDFAHAIVYYEYNENAEIKNDKVYIDGKEITEYTFKQNYYLMVGDNRHNSEDGRYWGLVPADHIVGKALFTWWSVDASEDWSSPLDKVRWDRVFRLID